MTYARTIVSALAVLVTTPASAADRPWFGTWQLVLKDATEPAETLIYSDAGHGAMRMESVEARSVVVTHFDGKPAPDVGRGGKPGNALAIRAVSPRRYRWTFIRAGKPWLRGVNTLAADGRSFTEVSWVIATPSKVARLVYRRR